MPHSSCVENYSNNAKSQPNLNFYILLSGKQWRRGWLQAIGRTHQRLKFLHSYLFNCCMQSQRKYISAVLWRNPIRHASNIHPMYLTVSIRKSHMERPTQSCIRKFFFWCDGHSIFLHLNLPLNKNPHFTIMPFYYPAPILQKKSRRHMNPVVNN